MVISVVVVNRDEVVVGEGGGVGMLKKSFVKRTEVKIKDDTFIIVSVGVGSDTNGYEVTIVSSTSF